MADWLRQLAVAFLPRVVACWIWDWSEDLGIGLGAWAPHIFGRMLGGAVTWRRGNR